MSSESEPPLQIPSSFQEVEQLVKRLYLPGSPAYISQIQETLQQLQKSPDGWNLANALLGSDDEAVRFFGALTFTVKINSDWKSLSEESAWELLHGLLTWFSRLVNQSTGPLVIKKLCSTLVTYFIRVPTPWNRPLRHLVCCFIQGEAVAYDTLDNFPETLQLVEKLPNEQLAAILWFSSTLAEEVAKIDPNNIQKNVYHERVTSNGQDSVDLINRSFHGQTPGVSAANFTSDTLRQEGIKTFQSWVFYAQKAWVDSGKSIEPLRNLVDPVVLYLYDDDLFEVTAELLSDALSNYSKFFRSRDIDLLSSVLTSEWAENRLAMLKSGDFDYSSTLFGRLLLAFGDATVQDIARSIEDHRSQKLMAMFLELLSCDGYAVAEDEICGPALEFWSAFVEFLIDTLFDEEGERGPWFEPARHNIVLAIERCWAKIRCPTHEVSAAWDSDARKGFKDFRIDVRDVLQASYPLLGSSIFEIFVNIALESFNGAQWIDVEAALFCLNALADCLPEEGETEQAILSRLLGSSIFTQLSENSASYPAKLRQTAVNLLGHYASFYEKNTQYLPAALNFLFVSLEAPALAGPASRSISSLCSSCRESLVSELPAFLQQYERFLGWNTSDMLTKERVIGAIGAIIQALPSEEAKVHPLQSLLDFIEQDVERFVQIFNSGDILAAQTSGLTALRCMMSIGRSMQAPDDVPIDLEKETTQTVWTQEPGLSLQARIIQDIITVTDRLNGDTEIIDAACTIFRTGFTERSPGPFVFHSSVTVDFLLGRSIETSRLGPILTTASILVTSHSTDSASRIDQDVHRLLTFCVTLMQELGEPDRDPEIAQNCIDLFGKANHRYANVIFRIEPKSLAENAFVFTIRCLRGKEILPKRSAAAFWVGFVSLNEQPGDLQTSITEVIQYFGPHLADALMYNIGGEASRSELDSLSELLKKLVFKQLKTKAWLEASLFSEAFPSRKVEEVEKRRWLQKVIG